MKKRNFQLPRRVITNRHCDATYRFLMAPPICMLAARFKFQTNFRGARCIEQPNDFDTLVSSIWRRQRRALAHARTEQTHRNDARIVACNRDNYAALTTPSTACRRRFFRRRNLPDDRFIDGNKGLTSTLSISSITESMECRPKIGNVNRWPRGFFHRGKTDAQRSIFKWWNIISFSLPNKYNRLSN